VLVGIWFFGEAATPLRILLIFAIVACIAGLKLVA
jgi:quaternary ammonium compound-resistance protein SugE